MNILEDFIGGAYNRETGEFNAEFAKKEAEDKRGKLNIVLLGSTGVGKSALINAVFGNNVAVSGTGKPVTQFLEKYEIKTKGLVLWDTKGIETKDYEGTRNQIIKDIESGFEKAKQSLNHEDLPHVVWLCIKEGSKRIQESDLDLLEIARERKLPTVVVFTDTQYEDGDEFVEKAKNEIFIKYNDFPKNRFVRVNSVKNRKAGHEFPQSGLEDLLTATFSCLAEVGRNAEELISLFKKAQLVNKKLKLEQMINDARKIVHTAAAAAGATGAIPIPMADAPLIAAAQGAMIAKLNAEFEVDDQSNATTSVITSILGMTAVAQVGKTIVANAFKLIPSVGSVIGGSIRAATAVALTEAIGHAYIEVLKYYYNEDEGRTILPSQAIDIMNVFKDFYKQPK
ncbi:YcjF family protein [Avibacterium sp. 20-129]|uniref:YcjF family protein n=1 Tax=Avibacterium sp. 20-129 TaxID=2911525 RepID=UPI002246B0E0|nr:GTPase [Avibacterium sp. 20-129]MCW9699117.1 50S ribosome-binding GTPase [Avibacterium sp. 20-129]